jgi:hypothetical protein
MSRARPFTYNNDVLWFDQKSKATVEQLELLADYEGISLDDLLDEGLGQRQVLFRLRVASDPNLIPAEVLERRRQRQIEHESQPACRICSLNGWECEGRITRHHFVPRWLMLELENYQAYSSRSACTVSICIGRHRDLHWPSDPDSAKTIVPYLRDHERRFADKLLTELREQHPKIFDLVLAGDPDRRYETQLLTDYIHGEFSSAENAYTLDEYFTSATDLKAMAGA